jgi:hypothetical protein
MWWAKMRQKFGNDKPLLTFRDGGDFLTIRQVLPDGRVIHHKLSGMARTVYLEITDIKTFNDLHKLTGNQLKSNDLDMFLQDLKKKRLVFMDGERIIALAVRQLNQWFS